MSATSNKRLSLTKSQLQQAVGQELLSLLADIVADGVLSDAEVAKLDQWLEEHNSEALPGIAFLAEAVGAVVATGRITEADRTEIQLGIERVLPVTQRAMAREARESAEAEREAALPPKLTKDDLKRMSIGTPPLDRGRTRGGSWRDEPMSEAQRRFIRSLGGLAAPNLSKGQASDLIESMLGSKPLSNRQKMVLRFWDRKQRPGEGGHEIMEWMDEFYAEDPDRKRAWELFKEESEDNGLQGDPNRVPVGVGPNYLRRIKSGGTAATPRFRPENAKSPMAVRRQISVQAQPNAIFYGVVVGLGLVAACIVTFFVFLKYPPVGTPRIVPPLHSVPNAREASSRELTPVQPKEKAMPTDVLKATITRLRISGIIGGGAKTRAIINGELRGVGDVVDRNRRILVFAINPEKRVITFIDAAGNTASKNLE